jgi:hypothetical protein
MYGPSMRRQVSGVPQAAQKPRSTILELLKMSGGFDQCTWSARKRTKAMNGWPVAFWHMRQKQTLARSRGGSHEKRTAPHWQPPE